MLAHGVSHGMISERNGMSPEGATQPFFRPYGAGGLHVAFPWLTPWANLFRP